MTPDTSHPSATLAAFAAGLRFEDIPAPVLRRAEELFLDWLGSALASQNRHPIPVLAIDRYAAAMGPADGPSQILINRRRTSPVFAALVNGAASHVVEQDDLHNSSVLHPATVVFPAALAAAQELGRSGRELILATVAGYEAGIRIGEFLGRSHYRIFHTTATVGTLAAAVAVGHLLGLSPAASAWTALGSAGTQAAGLWEFLRDAADSKQLHTAKAAADGLLAAYLTPDGLTGARHILEGEQGMAAGMSSDADPSAPGGRPGHPLGAARDLVQVPRLLPPYPSGGRRAARPDAARTQAGRKRYRARGGAPACTRAPSTCSAVWSSRRRCTRRSSPWAPCWA